MKWYIFLSIYWLACIAVIYVARYISSRKPINQIASFLIHKKNKWTKHLKIILLAPFVAILGIFYLIIIVIERVQKKRWKNRPKPIKGKLKNSLKSDRVIDENGNIVSKFQYNKTHNTLFTLDDVYGKGYEAKLDEKELAELKAEQEHKSLKIQEGLPDTPHKQAAITLAEALLRDDYTDFEALLDDASELVIYDKQSFKGKDEVISYWKIAKYPIKENYVVTYCAFYSNAALKLFAMNYATLWVLFRFEGGKIKNMAFAPERLHDWSLGYIDDLNKLPMKVGIIKRILVAKSVFEPKQNHLFCPQCGAPSESLDWYRVNFSREIHGYLGDVSICWNCNRVVEYRADIRYRLEKPRPDEINDNEKTTPGDINIDEPQNELVRIWNDYYNCLNHLQHKETENVEDAILKTLTSLSLAPGLKLGIHWAFNETNSIGGISWFYTFNESTGEEYRHLKGIQIESNEKAIWQLYLLLNTPAILPSSWHSNYTLHEYVMSMNDCLKIKDLRNRDLRNFAETGLISPSVIIEKNYENELIASVYCCYWNDFEGLIREQVRISIENNSIKTSKTVGKTVLHQYYCEMYDFPF